jgi:zinc transport system ATP-binding protein
VRLKYPSLWHLDDFFGLDEVKSIKHTKGFGSSGTITFALIGKEFCVDFASETARYPGSSASSLPALQDVSLNVYPGDRIGAVGPNGGGKTTLVKLILGLFRPTSGTVTLCGRAARWSRHVPEVGYIGNPSRNDGESGLPLDLTVSQLLDCHQALFHRSGLAYPHAALLSARLDLDKPEWRRKGICELSDGWRQRVLAYLALVKQPRLLIADEATAGLDPPHRRAVLDTIDHALKTTDLAVLWVTHDHNELLALRLHKVMQVERGRLSHLHIDGWQCDVSVDGAPSQRLQLMPDALFKLLSELALSPQTRSVRLNLARSQRDQTEVSP